MPTTARKETTVTTPSTLTASQADALRRILANNGQAFGVVRPNTLGALSRGGFIDRSAGDWDIVVTDAGRAAAADPVTTKED